MTSKVDSYDEFRKILDEKVALFTLIGMVLWKRRRSALKMKLEELLSVVFHSAKVHRHMYGYWKAVK